MAEPGTGDAHDRLAAGLGVGAWLELELESGERVRARLTWVSASTGTCLFTDRRGLKVAEMSRKGLAVALRRGTAQVLDTVPLYDRAVSSLMDRLRAATG